MRLITPTGTGYLTSQYVFDAQHLPVTGKDFLGTGRMTQHVRPIEGREHAGVAQIVAGDLGDILGQWRPALPTERNDRDGRGPVAATGDFDGVLRQGNLGQEQHGSTCQPVLHGFHQNAKSSGLKRKVRCLYIRSKVDGLSRDNCCISGMRPTFRTACTAD